MSRHVTRSVELTLEQIERLRGLVVCEIADTGPCIAEHENDPDCICYRLSVLADCEMQLRAAAEAN